MPVIAYLADHAPRRSTAWLQASAEFAAAHGTPQRQFLSPPLGRHDAAPTSGGAQGVDADAGAGVRGVTVLCFIHLPQLARVVVAVVPLVVTSFLCER